MRQRRLHIARLCWSTVQLCCILYIAMPDLGRSQAPAALKGNLVVFAAASLTAPFTALATHLESLHPQLKIIYNFGGSSALRTQLEQGAQADMFASADQVQMERARAQGVIQGDAPIFVRNRLVVIMSRSTPTPLQTFQDLARPGLSLVLAAAQVPVGSYSRQALEQAQATCGAHFAAQVLRNLVSEEDNVKQVVTKVQLGEADAGIVYHSDVTPQVSQAVLTLQIPDAYNQVATYPIALTAGVVNRQAAEAFVAFVLSAAGQALFKAHNFMPVQD